MQWYKSRKTPQCNLSQKLLIFNVVIYTCLRERYHLAETWSWRNRNRASSSSRGLCRRERKRCSRTPRKPRRGGVPGRLGGGLRRKSMPERRRPSREPPLMNRKKTMKGKKIGRKRWRATKALSSTTACYMKMLVRERGEEEEREKSASDWVWGPCMHADEGGLTVQYIEVNKRGIMITRSVESVTYTSFL